MEVTCLTWTEDNLCGQWIDKPARQVVRPISHPGIIDRGPVHLAYGLPVVIRE